MKIPAHAVTGVHFFLDSTVPTACVLFNQPIGPQRRRGWVCTVLTPNLCCSPTVHTRLTFARKLPTTLSRCVFYSQVGTPARRRVLQPVFSPAILSMAHFVSRYFSVPSHFTFTSPNRGRSRVYVSTRFPACAKRLKDPADALLPFALWQVQGQKQFLKYFLLCRYEVKYDKYFTSSRRKSIRGQNFILS